MVFPFLVLLRRLHPQPPTTDLALGFLLGMGVTFPVVLARNVVAWPEGGLLGAFLTAGGLEEGVKLGVGWLFLRRLAEEVRVGPAEGALVLAFLGAGFEAVEDLQYLLAGGQQGVPLGELLLARGLPVHLALGLVVGFFLGSLPGWKALPVWALAAGLHGGFNALAGRVPYPALAGYTAGLLAWGLVSLTLAHHASPWSLPRRLSPLDPWRAGLEVHRLGWEGVRQVLAPRAPSGVPWWVLGLGLAILYPLLVLALGLLLQGVAR